MWYIDGLTVVVERVNYIHGTECDAGERGVEARGGDAKDRALAKAPKLYKLEDTDRIHCR